MTKKEVLDRFLANCIPGSETEVKKALEFISSSDKDIIDYTMSGFEMMDRYVHNQKSEYTQAAYISGMILGVMLARMNEDPEGHALLSAWLKDYEIAKKESEENKVIYFNPYLRRKLKDKYDC